MNIPHHVLSVLGHLNDHGYQAFLVGGSVRDYLLNRSTTDWDITTDARPEQVQELFPDSVYKNTFGTVGIKHRFPETTEVTEITTFRQEQIYGDHRHPEHVAFVPDLKTDVKRRDFTINALAMDKNGHIIDYVGGQTDLQEKRIRTVGNPEQRFAEDALRLLRAVRFAVQLDFTIDPETAQAIQKQSSNLQYIAQERIRDELSKMMMTPRAMQGYVLLHQLGLLPYIMPELEEGIGVMQNGHHVYDVWEHLLRTMQHACDKNWSFDLRIAGLLHDIAKPRTKEGESPTCSFHGHEVVGASMAYDIMTRLTFPKKQCKRISKLVRYHMFYYNINEVTESSVRRLVRNVGKDNIKDLVKLRECDRIGSGTPKARPYRLRHFEYMVDKVITDPIDLSMLAIDGNTLIQEVGITPGPQIGILLNVLLAEVLDNPHLNAYDYLTTRAKDLQDQELKGLKERAISRIEEQQREQDRAIRAKYYLK